ncbi:unnamed protein product [Leuciscus chuanchicus]
MDHASTSTAVNQTVAMETDAEETDAVEEAVVRKVDGNSEQRMSDDKGVGLNKDSTPSQIKVRCCSPS